MTSTQLRLETRPDAVAVLTIDQPGGRANVLTPELWADLGAAFASLAPRTDLRGLVIASAKPDVFVAGADLKLLANAPGPDDPGVRAFIDAGRRVLEALESLPFPTAAAVDGAALGGGLELALACDVRVCGANPKLQLGLPEVKLGLVPGWGGTQRLPRVVGMANAAEMLTSGRGLNAREAAWYRLADAVVAVGEVAEVAARLCKAARLVDLRERKHLPVTAAERAGFAPPAPDTAAGREAVRLMVEGAALPLADGIRLETAAFLRLAGSDDSKRRIAEFFATRKPNG